MFAEKDFDNMFSIFMKSKKTYFFFLELVQTGCIVTGQYLPRDAPKYFLLVNLSVALYTESQSASAKK